MIWTKGAHQSANFQIFDCSSKISPNLYFDRLLKVYKILAKKYGAVMSHDPKDRYKIWKKIWSIFLKMTIIWRNLTQALKSLQNLHFHLFLLCKVFNVWPKKGFSFMTQMGDAKFEEKLTCRLKNDMRYLANFHQST